MAAHQQRDKDTTLSATIDHAEPSIINVASQPVALSSRDIEAQREGGPSGAILNTCQSLGDGACVGNGVVEGDAAEKNRPGIRHARTQDLVDRLKARGRRLICTQTVIGFAFVMTSGLCYAAWSVSEAACESSPLRLKDWFLGVAIQQSVLGLMFFAMLFSLCRLLNGHILTAAIYDEDGRIEEAAAEADLGGVASACCGGVCGIIAGGCFLCVLVLFSIVWFILGILSAASAHSEINQDACDRERTLYWETFAISLSLCLLCQCLCPLQLWR